MDSIFDTFTRGDPDTVDHHIVLEGISWDDFMSIALRRDASGRKQPRLHYVDGVLELMTTSYPHEYIKKTLARCLEAWSEQAGVDLDGYGHVTIQNRRKRRAAEADECYFVGPRGRRTRPDLAIEVVWTHGGIDKLEVYRRLGVREVWIWEDKQISVYVFEHDAWHEHRASVLLRDVDLRLFERCIATGNQPKALRMLRRALKH